MNARQAQREVNATLELLASELDPPPQSAVSGTMLMRRFGMSRAGANIKLHQLIDSGWKSKTYRRELYAWPAD